MPHSKSDHLQLPFSKDCSKIANQRRNVLTSYDLKEPLRCLEIGAFDNPTITRNDSAAVYYMDAFTAAELKEKYSDNPRRRMDRVVDVDFVIRDGQLASAINLSMDLIVANHVVEHIKNVIDWLKQLRSISNQGASLFLTIPDKRYTFDYYKQESDVTDLIRNFRESKTSPDVYDVLRNLEGHQSVDVDELWSGKVPARIKHRSLSELLEIAETTVHKGYTDTHVSFFTPMSFSRIFEELFKSKFIESKLWKLTETRKSDNEFYALLKLQD